MDSRKAPGIRRPTCQAVTRAGTLCKRAPVSGRKRCRLHGGLSPGAPSGAKNGNYCDGFWTQEAVRERQWAREMVKAFAGAEET